MAHLGSNKTDRGMEKFAEKHFRNSAPEKLRQMEKNAKRKPQEECQMCVRMVDRVYPENFWMCSRCVERHAKRYGKIFIISKKDYLYPVYKKMCLLCGRKMITFFQVNVKSCDKCVKKIGKIHSKEYIQEFQKSGKRHLNEVGLPVM